MLFSIHVAGEGTFANLITRHHRAMAAAVAATVVALFVPASMHAKRVRAESLASPPAIAEGQDEADTGFEAKFLERLSAGQQSEAEELIAKEVSRYPKFVKLAQLVASQKDKQAVDYMKENLSEIRPAQRAAFLLACCQRTRFDVQTASLIFNTVQMLDHRTPAAKCAYCMLWMDSEELRAAPQKEVNRAFGILRKLADDHSDDVMIRWMLAVQCRSWNRDEEGVDAYRQVLQHWNPGPALVHQTYANLLDNLERYDEALVERYLVVKMEPASWSYDGLGNTLSSLSRFDEACAAHAMATRMNPDSSTHWSNWALALNGQHNYDEAIKKSQQALKLSPKNWRAYWTWAVALHGQGKLQDALKKGKTAVTLYPDSPSLNDFVATLKKELDE